MNRRLFLSLAIAATTFPAFAAEEPLPRNEANVSFRNEIKMALDRGLAYLKSAQKEDGSWSDPLHPSLTALPVTAFHREPTGKYTTTPRPDFLKKSYAYLRSHVKPDGGIYKEGLSNYNTSIAMTALLGTGDAQDDAITRGAREFIVKMQAKGMAKPELDGGIGYGATGVSPKRQHPDLDNTVIALEALHAYRTAKPSEEIPAAKDLNWEAAAAFLSRTQNLPETNKEAWASGDAANRGGFIYYPGFSNAGEQELPDGKKALRSYGSMSYAGLLSFIYADVKKDDQRVVAALDWLRGNFSLTENPGLGQQGYYYYLHLMTKALTAVGLDSLELKDGKKLDWRKDVGLTLLNRQAQDGSWVNDTARWMEKDPILVTTYAVLSLELIYRGL